MKRSARSILILFAALIITFSICMTVAFAKSMSDAERSSYMKTASPMDKAPETVTLSKGANEAHGAGESTGFQLLLDGDDWLLTDKGLNDWNGAYKVSVPSSISGALYKAGVIGNPVYGRNDAKAKELGNRSWYYKKVFNYSGKGKNVYLCFEGVADRMDVYLNGVQVGTHQGMFGGPYIDVSDKIRNGENELVVLLRPVLNYTKTVVFNCSYAWHYADLPPIGIWNSVTVEDRADNVLDSPFITTVSHETGTMDLSVDIADLSGKNSSVSGTLYFTVSPKNFEGDTYSFEYKLTKVSGKDRNIRLRFDIPDFKLWWPNGYGEQNLYTLESLFIDDAGGMSYDISTFGVRTLVLTSGDKRESTNMYNRTAVFNGKTVFLKGADWCTIDAVMNFTREDYDRILCRAYDQGLNVFRAWGGGMCETDDFYDLCDEYGLCVYQEWPCCWDSQKTQPKDVLYETVILNTKRIRNRASLLVYGGGNEGEAPLNDEVMNNIGKLTYQYDGTRDFWRQDGGAGSLGIIHDHIHWGGETPEHYAEVYYDTDRNFHEYGLDSMMNLESIAKFATAEEMAQWPIDPEGTVAYHTATFNGMKGWNPTPYGYDIDTFIHYASQFVEVKDLASLVQGSQIAQTMADYFAAFNSRVNFPTQSMVMVYKFNDVYPGASWSVVDYYGAPKMAYWFLQDVYKPLTAGLKTDRYDTYNKIDKSLNLPVYIVDDADELSGSDWQITVKAYDNRFNVIKSEQYSGSGSINMTKQAGEFKLTSSQTSSAPLFLVTTLYKNGEFEARTYMFMNSGKDPGSLFALPAADVSYTTGNGVLTVKNNGDVPAVAVYIDSGENSDVFRPSDNYFWLEPGESLTVKCNDVSFVKGLGGFNMLDKEDKTAPSKPDKLSGKSDRYDSVTLSWKNNNSDGDVRYYEIYLNSYLFDIVKGTAESYVASGLAELSEYDFYVVAVDGGMNRSEESKTVTVKTVADNDLPRAIRFEMTGPDTGIVVFSRKVDPESASNTDYYILNLGASVTKAEPQPDGYSVDLTFSGLESGLEGRTLTVMGVRDTTNSANPAARSKFKLDDMLVGYWSFDDKKDMTYDASGYHTASGNAGGSLAADGVSGGGIMPKSGDIVLSQTDLTLKDTVISFWINAGESYSGFNVFLCKGDKVSGHFEIYTNEGDLKLYCPDICDSSFGVNMRKYSGSWTHMCFVWEDGSEVCYINGEKAGSVKLSKDVIPVTFDLILGSLPGGQFMTDAAFDELMFVKSTKGKDIVSELYNRTFLKDIRFEKADYRMKPGSSDRIEVIRTNVDSALLLEWVSSDESVAAVDQEGNITAVSEGTALITARTADGQYIERCLVEVGDFKEEKPRGNSSTVWIVVAIIIASALIAAAVIIAMTLKKKKNS